MNRPVAMDPLGPSTLAHHQQLSLFPPPRASVTGLPGGRTAPGAPAADVHGDGVGGGVTDGDGRSGRGAGAGVGVGSGVGAEAASLRAPHPEATPAESRRQLRPEAAPRQARRPPSGSDDLQLHERAIAVALKSYLPPGKALELSLTNNHYSMISVRRKPDGYRLRLHRMFVGATPRTVRALARYVVHNDHRASRWLGDFIDRHQHIIKLQARSPRRIAIRSEGSHHHLQRIFDRLNSSHFGGGLAARITWGTASAARARRSIKMGSFAVEDRVIRIHPVLDHRDVPEYFVAWIVFHEMLHGKHDIVRKGERRVFHSQAFLDEERTFPDFERATDWERANLDRLLGG